MSLHAPPPQPPSAPLFPYTTLFRSAEIAAIDDARYRGLAVDLRLQPGDEQDEQPEGRYRPHPVRDARSEEHTSELQSHSDLVCRLLLEKKKDDAVRVRAAVKTAGPR